MGTPTGSAAASPEPLPGTIARWCPHFAGSVDPHPSLHDGWPCPYWRAGCLLAGLPDPFDDVAEWRVDISGALDAKGKVPLSLNYRLHWAAYAQRVDRVKSVTRNSVMAVGVPHLAHVHVEIHFRPKTVRFRDVDNIVATLKPAIDGLHQRDTSVNAPVPYDPIIDGDDARYLTWSMPVLHGWIKGEPPALWLILRSYT